MKTNIGTNARDAEASRRTATKEGGSDGANNYPPKDPDGNAGPDYHGRAQRSEADTTDAVTKGAHVNQRRVDDDERIAKCRAQTPRHTTLTDDARRACEDALAEQRAYQQRLPLSAKFGFWPRWLVYLLLVLLAIASGAAVTAALLAVTTDQKPLTYVIGAGVAIATVVGGASLGTLLRRRDLDSVKNGRYASSGHYTTGVLIAGILGVIALGAAVASLRHDASEADAARRAAATHITLFIPGQSATGQSQPSGPVNGVSWLTWGLLEYGLAAAAISIEFQRSDVRAEHREQLDRAASSTHATRATEHSGLAGAVGEHEAAIATRADHDLAVTLTGSSQRSFADVLTSDYRRGNLANRGQGGADPFEVLAPHERLALDATFDKLPGTDVLRLAVEGEFDEATLTKLVASNRDLWLLQAAYHELAQSPQRPARADHEPWIPGAYLALDPAAQALATHNTTAKPASTASTVGEVDVGKVGDDTQIDVTEPAPDTVPDELVGPNSNGHRP